ncbi:unnamed protein product [Vitrella brassicaformis CCMP3155]|uniref:Uncharacterized protein n=1 Tax=Vitrella brassicaformis (strain CCMP3155) TaxID=1169540 RepID=A0A0G4GNM9_VITBC|nr:unnamed protein product [Vitrella brassicaformis CCMP3155]|eukprot:CEM31892.1 unnamed protein product [Vitrella brassicaformis CCMP3155]
METPRNPVNEVHRNAFWTTVCKKEAASSREWTERWGNLLLKQRPQVADWGLQITDVEHELEWVRQRSPRKITFTTITTQQAAQPASRYTNIERFGINHYGRRRPENDIQPTPRGGK